MPESFDGNCRSLRSFSAAYEWSVKEMISVTVYTLYASGTSHQASMCARDAETAYVSRRSSCTIGHGTQGLLVPALVDERTEHAFLILQKLARLAKLGLQKYVSNGIGNPRESFTYNSASIEHHLYRLWVSS